jgi:acetyl esterase/lipase
MKHTKVSIFMRLMVLLSAVVLASGCVPQLEGVVVAVTATPSPLPPTTTPLPTSPIELYRTDLDGYQSRLARDVSYVPDGNSYQKLDVYLPTEGKGPFPTVLAIHGGCFHFSFR